MTLKGGDNMQGLRTNPPKVNSLQELFSPWQIRTSEVIEPVADRDKAPPVVAAVSDQIPEQTPLDLFFP